MLPFRSMWSRWRHLPGLATTAKWQMRSQSTQGSGPLPQLMAMADEMKAWRHDFHMHPELAFEEVRQRTITRLHNASFRP